MLHYELKHSGPPTVLLNRLKLRYALLLYDKSAADVASIDVLKAFTLQQQVTDVLSRVVL